MPVTGLPFGSKYEVYSVKFATKEKRKLHALVKSCNFHSQSLSTRYLYLVIMGVGWNTVAIILWIYLINRDTVFSCSAISQ